jgi:O-antigen/teichoic acid export membrane protein
MLTNKLKSFTKDSLVYGVGDALGRLVSLVMLPILSRAFLPADYGAIDLLTVGYAFILIGISLNINPGITKNYYTMNGTERKRLVSSASFFTLLISISVSIPIFFLPTVYQY